jgi:hypothetical protein
MDRDLKGMVFDVVLTNDEYRIDRSCDVPEPVLKKAAQHAPRVGISSAAASKVTHRTSCARPKLYSERYIRMAPTVLREKYAKGAR